MKSAEVIIKTSGLHKSFFVKGTEIKVLKGIDLEINQGDFCIIFGPSGSGKTTLLNTMLGLEVPTKGYVKMGKWIISDYDEDSRAQIRKPLVGIIYQQMNWIKSLRVLDNVAFPLLLMGKSKREAIATAKKLIEEVGMTPWMERYPVELSAGQQQKIALARSLVTDPPVIFADEPTGNLDYKSGFDLIFTFQQLVSEGKTVVMVTHNYEYLGSVKKVHHMLDGRIIKSYNITPDNVKDIQDSLINMFPLKSAKLKDG